MYDIYHIASETNATIIDTRLTFWIQLFTKARDFTTKESLTSAHILNIQRLFNTRISLPATLKGSEKVL